MAVSIASVVFLTNTTIKPMHKPTSFLGSYVVLDFAYVVIFIQRKLVMTEVTDPPTNDILVKITVKRVGLYCLLLSNWHCFRFDSISGSLEISDHCNLHIGVSISSEVFYNKSNYKANI